MPSAPKWLADFPIGTEDLGRMGTNKIGMYRARFRQDQVLSGGTYSNWTRLDNLAKQASLQGVTLVPILINMPGETYTPPHTSTERDQFGSFAAAAARRYGPKGSFWSSCGCPFLPVQVWEVWNEPNMAPYWDAPSAVDYAGMLQVVRSKLRAVDRAARIMVGGLAYAGSYDGVTRINPNDFLRAVIQTNGVNAFDALALHDYHSVATSGVSAIGGTVGTQAVRRNRCERSSPAAGLDQRVRQGHRPRRSLDPDVDESAQSEITQRDWLNAFLDGVLANRAAWNLGPSFWYSIRDDANPNAAWLRLGLRRTNSDDTDGGPKLAWDAYVARSSVAPTLPLPVVR